MIVAAAHAGAAITSLVGLMMPPPPPPPPPGGWSGQGPQPTPTPPPAGPQPAKDPAAAQAQVGRLIAKMAKKTPTTRW